MHNILQQTTHYISLYSVSKTMRPKNTELICHVISILLTEMKWNKQKNTIYEITKTLNESNK